MLVHESHDRETDFKENKYLTDNVLITTNKLFGSSLGWEEITENQTRYQSSSNLLSVSDSAGYLLFSQSNNLDIQDSIDLTKEVNYNFTESELKMKSTLWPANAVRPADSYCYKFQMSEICVPKVAFDEIDVDDVIEVSVEYNLGNDTNLFPNTFGTKMGYSISDHYLYEPNYKENASLGSHLVGLAINNGTNELNIPPDQPVVITFHHEATQVNWIDIIFS